MHERRSLDSSALAIMVALCAVIGTQQTAIKLAQPDMSPVLQVGVRSGIAAMAVLALIYAKGEWRALCSANWRPGVLAGALFGIEFVLFGQGMRLTSASHMSIFLYTAPIFAALFLHFQFPEERLASLQWCGIVTAFLGVIVAFSGRGSPASSEMTWLGDLLGIAAGVAFGATTLVIRGSRLASAPARVTLWYQLAGGFLCCVSAAYMFGEVRVDLTPILSLSIAYQAIVISTLSYIIWFSMMRTYLVSRISILSLMTPVFGVLFGVLVLGDQLTASFLAGAALIVAGMFLVSGHDALRSWIASSRAMPSLGSDRP